MRENTKKPVAVPADGQWILAPVNPEYEKYIKDLQAGKNVSPVMPPRMKRASPAGVPDTGTARRPPMPAGLRSYSFPASYDLRTSGKVTPSKTSDCGSCWTSASLGSLESNLAPQEVFDFSENHMQLNHGCDFSVCGGGAHEGVAMNYLVTWQGPVNESDYDYTVTEPQNPSVQRHVQNVYCLPDRNDPLDNDWLKSAILAFGGLYSNGSRSSGYNFTNNTYYNPVKTSGHAAVIVGWDDNFSRDLFFYNHPDATEEQKIPPGDGAFIVKDNQGSAWGDNGYFYVSYYDGAFGSWMTAFTAEPVTNYNRIYQHDTFGTNDSIYVVKNKGGPSFAANIFIAAANEDLAAVGFFNLGYVTGDYGFPEYRIRVYLEPVNGPYPQSKLSRVVPAATVSVTVPMGGYYTIKLPQKVPLKKGQKFSVVLSGVQNGQGVYMAVERPIWGYSTATANPGEGFVSADGTSWQDVTLVQVYNTETKKYETINGTSLCIKAYTNRRRSVIGGFSGFAQTALVWKYTNTGETAVAMKPVAQLSRKASCGFAPFGAEITGESYLDHNGASHATSKGWVQIAPGETVTILSKPEIEGKADRVACSYSYRDPQRNEVRLWENWKYWHLTVSPLHVLATEPMNNALVDSPLHLIRVIFNKEVKPGPGLNSISVVSDGSPGEVKISFNSVSGDLLMVALISPVSISQDPGAGKVSWQVHVPADAVTDLAGNTLNQDHNWSFTACRDR